MQNDIEVNAGENKNLMSVWKKKIVSLNFDLVLVTHEFVKYLKLENE